MMKILGFQFFPNAKVFDKSLGKKCSNTVNAGLLLVSSSLFYLFLYKRK